MYNQFENESDLNARIIFLGGSTDGLVDMTNDGSPIYNRPRALERIRELEAHQLQKDAVRVSKRALTVSWVAIGISVIALITSVFLVLTGD